MILVSELMLQQTQASRVVDRLTPFLDEFPTPEGMAQGSVATVISAWNGLGYNRRAVNLHRTARKIVDEHRGAVPDNLGDLLDLPGVGPYTARAVLVFAFERSEAVVDTNIGRVLARWEGRTLGRQEAQELADRLVSHDDPWGWNQALMELGALICTGVPQCVECPVSNSCRWFVSGRDGADPASGSAAVSRRQSRFDGSDRQGRSALVRTLSAGPVSESDLPVAMGWPDDAERAHRVVKTLLTDGLVTRSEDGGFELPT